MGFGKGLLLGAAFVAAGAALEAWVLGLWVSRGFGPMNEPRPSVLGRLMLAMGAEIAVFSFLHAVLRKHLGSRASAPG